MTGAFVQAGEIDLGRIRQGVDRTLAQLLEEKARSPYGAPLAIPLRVLRDFLGGGGKRLRPIFCYCGWLAAGGDPDAELIAQVAAGVELVHAYLLLHDDVIDASDVRRGHPTAQRAFDLLDPHPRIHRFGEHAAVLLGDLCHCWAEELFSQIDGPHRAAARHVLNQMHTEVLLGQMIELRAARNLHGTVEDALASNHLKTTCYTVMRPLHLGATLAGASAELLEACSAYAEPLGQAFSLFDDLEDVVLRPDDPGYVGNDLKEGKATVVLCLALQRAAPSARERLAALIGDPALDAAGAAEARALIAATGAPDTVIDMIDDGRAKALAALDRSPFTEHVTRALRDLALRGVPFMSKSAAAP